MTVFLDTEGKEVIRSRALHISPVVLHADTICTACGIRRSAVSAAHSENAVSSSSTLSCWDLDTNDRLAKNCAGSDVLFARALSFFPLECLVSGL